MPTYFDVMQYFIHLKNEKTVYVKVQYNKSEVINSVASSVEIIWKNASIPIVDHLRVCQYIQGAGAFIATLALQDYGLITKSKTVNVIDKNKVRNSRTRKKIELRSNTLTNKVNGLYFDGPHNFHYRQSSQKYYREAHSSYIRTR